MSMDTEQTEKLIRRKSNILDRLNEDLKKIDQDWSADISDLQVNSIIIGPLPGLTMCKIEMESDWTKGLLSKYIFAKDSPELDDILKIVKHVLPTVICPEEATFSNSRGY